MSDKIENRLQDLGRTLGTDDTMAPRVMARIDKALGDQPFKTGTMKREFVIRRLVMNRMKKLAAAAVILIGVVLGYQAFKGTGGVSWAQVLQQVAAARTVTYTLTVTAPEIKGLRLEGFQSSDRGIRMDAYVNGALVNQSYTLVDEGRFVTLMTGQKLYTEVKLTEALREEVRRGSGDPRAIVDEFLQGGGGLLIASECVAHCLDRCDALIRVCERRLAVGPDGGGDLRDLLEAAVDHFQRLTNAVQRRLYCFAQLSVVGQIVA